MPSDAINILDAARSLFDAIDAGGEAWLQEAQQDKSIGTRLIDFKMAGDEKGALTRSDRKSLATALSGFANSEGGVIVWGVNCRLDSQGVDTIIDLKPIKGIKRFLSDLQNNTSSLVSPGVSGVDHSIIAANTDSDAGYVVSYIPKSQGLLHMAMAADQHCYYYRSGSSFLPMEAWMVADRYGRRPQPTLELVLEVGRIGKPQATLYYPSPHWDKECRAVFGIFNSGLGLARFPAIRINALSNAPVKIQVLPMQNHNWGLPIQHSSYRKDKGDLLAGGVNDVIYPGSARDIGTINFLLGNFEQEASVTIEFELYCEGYARTEKFVITPMLEQDKYLRL